MAKIKPKNIPPHLHQWKLVEYEVVDGRLVYIGEWVCNIFGIMTIFEDRQYYV